MEITRKKLRELAVALLDDKNGICHSGYCILSEILDEVNSQDIIKEVKGVLGRYYLDEDHDFQNEKPPFKDDEK